MIKNQQMQPKSSILNVTNRSNVEELIMHLCSKIAISNNLNEIYQEDFINRSYSNMIKLFCSITYRPVNDSFEITQKIKNKC